jgi:probable phosphoglycerate mutase
MSVMLYFLRHGETQSSQSGSFCGVLDLDLTPEGHQMAADFAAAYRAKAWAAVFCSPLRRGLDTAQPLCDALGLELQRRDGLMEIAYGAWESMTQEAVNQQFHDDYVRWLADPGWNAPNGGERGVDVARRSTAVLDEILSRHRAGNVLIVSHKATIRIMLCSLLGIDFGRYRDRIDAPVASLAVVEMTDRGPLLRRLADRAHLREPLRARPGT